MKAMPGKFGLLVVIAAALFVLQGCVVVEDTGCANETAVTGSGSFLDPWNMGTAPACDEFITSDIEYYSVFIPLAGTWFFDLRDMSADLDLFVTDVTGLVSYCSSTAAGSSDEACTIFFGQAQTTYVEVDSFAGSVSSYTLDVY